eukprot:5573408-Amphidinium_carterae.1
MAIVARLMSVMLKVSSLRCSSLGRCSISFSLSQSGFMGVIQAHKVCPRLSKVLEFIVSAACGQAGPRPHAHISCSKGAEHHGAAALSKISASKSRQHGRSFQVATPMDRQEPFCTVFPALRVPMPPRLQSEWRHALALQSLQSHEDIEDEASGMSPCPDDLELLRGLPSGSGASTYWTSGLEYLFLRQRTPWLTAAQVSWDDSLHMAMLFMLEFPDEETRLKELLDDTNENHGGLVKENLRQLEQEFLNVSGRRFLQVLKDNVRDDDSRLADEWVDFLHEVFLKAHNYLLLASPLAMLSEMNYKAFDHGSYGLLPFGTRLISTDHRFDSSNPTPSDLTPDPVQWRQMSVPAFSDVFVFNCYLRGYPSHNCVGPHLGMKDVAVPLPSNGDGIDDT